MKSRLRIAVLGLPLAIIAAAVIGSWWAAGQWLRPSPRAIGTPPPDLEARTVEFSGADGHRLRGWLAPGRGAGGVVLVHGVRESRRAMLGRAGFLHRAGYAVLLFDLSAHGESDGEQTGFGAAEAADVRAAVEVLRAAVPGEKIAAIGFSLGAAACVLGAAPLPVDALVLEAPYADIDTAIGNRLRLRFGTAGPWLTPLLTAQLWARRHIPMGELRPVDAIRRAHVPVLVIAGSDDPRSTPADVLRVFAAANEPKELWIVPGAGHTDFHRAAPQEYERRVLAFLAHAFS